jgi:hypothetical protein
MKHHKGDYMKCEHYFDGACQYKWDIDIGYPVPCMCNYQSDFNGDVPAPGWRDVREELPKEDGRYIVYDSQGQIVTEMCFITGDYDNSGWYVSAYHKEDAGQVTHWMPLPAPPEGVQR